MAQTIKLRRSSSSGAVPTTSQLELGEVAINTYDGKMYIKKNVGGTETVVEIGAANFADAIVTRGITTYTYTATASQTTFSGADDNSATLAYTVNQIQVFLNGVLLDSSDYTASNGTSIVLSSGAEVDDTLSIVAYYTEDLDAAGDLTVGGVLIVGSNEFPTDAGAEGEVLTADGSGLVEWKLPQTLSYLVYNADSTTIAAGEPVYVFGANGANISVKRALNTSDATCAQTLGLANESIASGSTGVIIAQGLLRGIDTTGYTAGQALYLGSTAGSITTTKPYAPNHLVYLGFVQTATNNGRIFVRTQNGYELDEIHDVQITSTPSDGDVLAYDSATSLWKPTADYAQLGEAQTWTANQTFDDNVKAIFGAGSDLQIYHTGTQSYVSDQGTGNLNLLGDARVVIGKADGTENMAQFYADAQVELYYNNSVKLATTSTGIDVTGTVVSDGLTVNGQVLVENGNTVRVERPDGLAWSEMYMQAGGSGGMTFLNNNNDGFEFKYTTGGDKLTIANNGDISFYEDTGTTAKLFWDASAESLGIGTTSPSSILHLSSSNDPQITLTDTGFGASADITGSNGNLRLNSQTATIFDMADSEVARINSSGDLLVSTTTSSQASNTNTAACGIALRTGGSLQISRDSDIPFYLNRLTTDGTIAEFRKDGTTIGSIASAPNAIIVGSGDVNLKFLTSSPAIYPRKANDTTSDGYTDLGLSSNRFKDLYLSGSARASIFYDSDNTAYYVDPANSTTSAILAGAVGIGTTSPSDKIHVYQNASDNIIGTFENAYLNAGSLLKFTQLTNGSVTNPIFYIGQGGDNTGDAIIYNASNTNIKFYTNSVERLRIGLAGTIDIKGTGSEAAPILYFAGDDDTGIFKPASNILGFSTFGIERLRIDSSGNVGIGTTSPTYKLQVDSGATDSSALFNSTSANGSHIRIASSGTVKNYIGNAAGFITSGSADDLGLRAVGKISFATNGAAADMTIDTSGNLGLGVTPSAWGSSYSPAIDIGTAGAVAAYSTSGIAIYDNAYINSSAQNIYKTTAAAAKYQMTGGAHYWSYAGSGTAGTAITFSEAMRIDASGNLLVGKTSTASAQTTVGHLLLADGRHYATASGGVSGIFSRTTSDGDILSFYKDGTAVGSIGVNTNVMYIGGTEGTDAYLGFGNDIVRPVTSTGASRDAAIDLGYTGMRFRSLYLSSSVLINAAVPRVTLTDTDGTNTIGDIRQVSDAIVIKSRNNLANGIIKFTGDNGTTETEYARIDASGNLLVGTTDSAPGVADTNVGVALNSGRVFASAEADYALNLNRNTSDGDIVRFRKDGTTVGSIEVATNTTADISVGSDNVRLLFFTNGSSIVPRGASNATADNAIDLGNSGNRFKDLYLSGNITVGGTVDGRDIATDGTKLDGIEAGATADQTASEILTAIKTVDGAGSGLDADLWDGNQFASYLNQAVLTSSSPTFADLTVSGNLTVSGTTTTVNTETINLADNIITLNSNYTGSTPTEDGGIEVERGTLTNARFIWDETNDRWSTDGSGLYVNSTITGNLVGNVTGNVSGSSGSTTGNAATATTLQTARTINGVSFDGSANINIGRLYSESGTTTNYLALSATNELELFNSSGVIQTLYLNHSGGATSLRGPSGSTIWTSGNDGTGSGLDADLLDGQEGSYYTNASNISSGTLSNDRLEDLFKAGTEIPTAANLNDYRTTGYYSQNANADAAAGSNYPVALAGILEVINDDTGNGVHTVQRYTRYSSPYTTYHRYYYNGTWGSWSTNWDSTNDGAGSGLDADLLDGQHGSYYQPAATALGYVDVATGDYGTIKVDDDRGVTWAGYAIRDDWVFMSNGPGNAGIYNDTDNEWAIYITQNAGVNLRYNNTIQFGTENGYAYASNQMRAPIFYDSNDTTYYVDPANGTTSAVFAGAVGIGTTSPAEELHIYKTATDPRIRISHGSNVVTGFTLGYSGQDVVISNTENGVMLFGTNNTERMRISSAGYVGIGTTSPDTILHLYHAGQPPTSDSLYASMILDTDSASNWQRIRFDVGATPYWGLGRQATTNDFVLSGRIGSTWSDSVFVIDQPTGNVGIGTSSPNGKLDIKLAPTPSSTTVNETADFADKFVIGTNASGNYGDKIPLVFNVGNSTGDHISTAIVGEREASGWTTTLSFWTNNQTSGTEGTDAIQEKMRITGAGNVGIGTTSPSQLLHIAGTGYAATDFRAPIFYDSDNTAYYVNPASRSYLNGVSSLGLVQSWGVTSGVNTGALNAIMGTGSSATWLLSGTSGGTFRYGIQALDAGGALRLYVGSNYLAFDGSTLTGTSLSGNATTATTLQTARTINGVSFDGSANITVADATKLPLTGGTLSGSLALGNNDITGVNELVFNDNVKFLDQGDNQYLKYQWGNTGGGGIILYDGDGARHGTFYGDGSGETGILDNDSHWAVRVRTGTNAMILYCNNNPEFYVYTSYTLSPGSSRAPIFYDSDNTNYYLNPAGGSRLADTTVTNYIEVEYTLTGVALDPGLGNLQNKTIAASTTFTDSLANGESMTLKLNGGATYAVTWPTMTWITPTGNSAPTLNGTNDVIILWKQNSILFGAYVGHS